LLKERSIEFASVFSPSFQYVISKPGDWRT